MTYFFNDDLISQPIIVRIIQDLFFENIFYIIYGLEKWGK
jgi:hypothetical protein